MQAAQSAGSLGVEGQAASVEAAVGVVAPVAQWEAGEGQQGVAGLGESMEADPREEVEGALLAAHTAEDGPVAATGVPQGGGQVEAPRGAARVAGERAAEREEAAKVVATYFSRAVVSISCAPFRLPRVSHRPSYSRHYRAAASPKR